MSRHESEDRVFFDFREEMRDRTFTLDDLDQFTLYVGIHGFARKKFIVDQLEKTLDVTGNIYEFGTWKGATLMLLASWYRLRRPQGNKLVYVFDAFTGLGDGTQEDGSAHRRHAGEYSGSEKELRHLVSARGLDPYVKFVVGDVTQTAEHHFSTTPLPKVSFALLDMDLYEPTNCALECLLPNLVPNGRIIFDEGTHEKWEGEQRALCRLVTMADELGMRYTIEENYLTRQPTTVFTRIE